MPAAMLHSAFDCKVRIYERRKQIVWRLSVGVKIAKKTDKKRDILNKEACNLKINKYRKNGDKSDFASQVNLSNVSSKLSF